MTRNALLNWSVHHVIERIGKEADELCKLPMLICLPSAKKSFDWCSVLEWSMSNAQKLIAITAPVLFALMMTISVSKDIQNQVKKAKNPTADIITSVSPPLPSNVDDGDLSDSDGEPELIVPAVNPGEPIKLKIKCDPWLKTIPDSDDMYLDLDLLYQSHTAPKQLSQGFLHEWLQSCSLILEIFLPLLNKQAMFDIQQLDILMKGTGTGLGIETWVTVVLHSSCEIEEVMKNRRKSLLRTRPSWQERVLH
ncbi:hypothetical protein C8J56DRAFT_884070 [Mycena floridula]|nr:hypothetical protein C8J56DRAFT_884070 [Mycena floridula]